MEAHSAAPSRVDSVLQMTNIPGADSAATCQTITTQVSLVSESDPLVKVEGQQGKSCKVNLLRSIFLLTFVL